MSAMQRVAEDGFLDWDFLPDLGRRDLGTRSEAAPTTKKHRLVVRSPRIPLRLRLRNRRGDVLSGYDYRLEIASETFEGQTDDRGGLEHRVPLEADEGILTTWLSSGEGERLDVTRWRVSAGGLEPETESLGAPITSSGC